MWQEMRREEEDDILNSVDKSSQAARYGGGFTVTWPNDGEDTWPFRGGVSRTTNM